MLRILLGCTLIALPLLELALLIKTGQLIGFWATLGVLVGAGILGAAILSRQSWTMVRQMQESLAQGRPPVAPVVDAVFLMLAAALLITPGFLSDALALLLLIPPLRHWLARWSVRRLVQSAHARISVFGAKVEGERGPAPSPAGASEGPTIDGEFERMDEKATGPHRRERRDRL